MCRRRVVVTGIGVVTSIGCERRPFWNHLLEGRSGISPVESLDTSRFKVHRGGEVKGFNADEHLAVLDPARVGRASKLAIAAARMAVADSRVDLDTTRRARVGVVIGTTSGEPLVVEAFDDKYVSDELEDVGEELISQYPCNLIASHIAAELQVSGVNKVIPTACAAGNFAIAHASDLLRTGRAELVLAGGADCFSRITFTGFSRLGAIAPEICQPFDRDRKGMMAGEGAAVLVLETASAARARGAEIYAEIGGYGLSCDAHHMTAAHPEGDGAARAMEMALRDSELNPEDVSYISAHGTGTRVNDRLETIAVKKALGPAAYEIPMSSIKSMLGHTMGAASAIEAAACALAVSDDCVPPTINFNEQDPECDLDIVPNSSREMIVDVAMNNAYAFGGNNASVILRKFKG